MKTLSKYPMIASIVILFSLAGCSELTKEDNAKEAVLSEEQLLLIEKEKSKAMSDSMQLAFAQTLNEIDHNLDLIREKEGTLILGPGSNRETGMSTREHIQSNLSFINSLMEQNKEKLQKLTAQLKKYKKENSLLAKLMTETKERIEKQEAEITLLKTELTDQSFEMAKLNMKMNDVEVANTMLQDKSDKLDKEVYSGYYAVGSYDELSKKNVVTKQGGVLGIGKKKIVKDDFQKTYFTQVDVRQMKAIPLYAKKAKLMTFHPKSSYTMTKTNDKITSLEIKNPDEFWKTSKYLVVEVQI